MKFKQDKVISITIKWLILFGLLQVFFVDRSWMDGCLTFCIQLKESVLGKLLEYSEEPLVRFAQLTAWVGLIASLVMLAIGIRMICKKTSWLLPRTCHTGAITFKKEKVWVYQKTQDVPKSSKRSATANLFLIPSLRGMTQATKWTDPLGTIVLDRANRNF